MHRKQTNKKAYEKGAVWLFLFCTYFLTYAFVGWCVEVAYAACRQRKFVNRGFLNGPLCPIYGFGVASIHLLLTPISDLPFPLLFLCSVLITSGLEWLTGFLLDRIFHHKWWDYTGEFLSLGGYICLKFSLIWGAACCLVVRFVFPLQDALYQRIPQPLGWVIVGALLSLAVLDAVATVCTIVGWNRQMSKVEAIGKKLRQNSDKIGSYLSRGVIVLWERHLARAEREGIFRRRLKKAFTEKPFLRKSVNVQEIRAQIQDLPVESEKKESENTAPHTFTPSDTDLVCKTPCNEKVSDDAPPLDTVKVSVSIPSSQIPQEDTRPK